MFHVSILVSHNIFLNVRHKSCWSHNKTLWRKLQISFQFLLQNGDWVLIYFTLTGAVVRLMAGYLMVLWCVGAVQSCRNHWVVFYRQTPGTDWTAVHYRDTFIRYTPRYATARWGAAGPGRRENMSFTLLLCYSGTLWVCERHCDCGAVEQSRWCWLAGLLTTGPAKTPQAALAGRMEGCSAGWAETAASEWVRLTLTSYI